MESSQKGKESQNLTKAPVYGAPSYDKPDYGNDRSLSGEEKEAAEFRDEGKAIDFFGKEADREQENAGRNEAEGSQAEPEEAKSSTSETYVAPDVEVTEKQVNLEESVKAYGTAQSQKSTQTQQVRQAPRTQPQRTRQPQQPLEGYNPFSEDYDPFQQENPNQTKGTGQPQEDYNPFSEDYNPFSTPPGAYDPFQQETPDKTRQKPKSPKRTPAKNGNNTDQNKAKQKKTGCLTLILYAILVYIIFKILS